MKNDPRARADLEAVLVRIDELKNACARALTPDVHALLDDGLRAITSVIGVSALPTAEVLDLVLVSKEVALTRAPSAEQQRAWTRVLSSLGNAIRAELGEHVQGER